MKKLIVIAIFAIAGFSCGKKEIQEIEVPVQMPRETLSQDWRVLFHLVAMNNCTQTTSVDIYDQLQTKIATLTPGSNLTNNKEVNCLRGDASIFYFFAANGSYHPYDAYIISYSKPAYNDSSCYICTIVVEQDVAVTMQSTPVSYEELQQFKEQML
jgi:hypothetical protein